MAYTKTTWQTGDIITAEKLNNMEDGIGSVLIVQMTTSDGTTTFVADTDAADIITALQNGIVVILSAHYGNAVAESLVTYDMGDLTATLFNKGFKVPYGSDDGTKWIRA